MSMAPRVIDLRSDTVTQPTNAMRRAMAEAELGDDVYGEDPTINRLEETAAERLGKEAGLFVVSGSMGNLVSALSWCNRGDEAIMGADAHLLVNEMGAIAAFGGVQMRPIPNDHRGLMTPEAIEATISPRGPIPTHGTAVPREHAQPGQRRRVHGRAAAAGRGGSARPRHGGAYGRRPHLQRVSGPGRSGR